MESDSPYLSPTKLQLGKVLASFLVPSVLSPRVARVQGKKFPSLEMVISGATPNAVVRLCAHKPKVHSRLCALHKQRYHRLAHVPLPQKSPPVLEVDRQVWLYLFEMGLW